MSPARRKSVRQRLFHLQAGKCCYCGLRIVIPKPGQSGRRYDHIPFATIEHLRRRADGGTDHLDNLALACRRCNSQRGAMSWVEFKTLKSEAAA